MSDYYTTSNPSKYNLSELDNLLEDLNTARNVQPQKSKFEWASNQVICQPIVYPFSDNGIEFSNTTVKTRGRSDSTQVNRLISDLEYDLHHPK